METPCLTDRNEAPNEEVLSRCLGRAKSAWELFNAILREDHPSYASEWRYYADGKRWLFKVVSGKKTVCWISAWRGLFRTTFYFTEAASDAIRKSGLPKKYVDQFVGGRKYGKIKGITVDVSRRADLEAVKILIGVKEKPG